MLDKVFSARYVYRFDEEMNEFFKTLIHVQYDLTGTVRFQKCFWFIRSQGDGPLQEGDECPNTLLYELDGRPTSLMHYMDKGKEMNLPLVVIAGSWTW